MGHAPPRSTHKPQTRLRHVVALYLADRIDVDELEARVGGLLRSGTADAIEPVQIAPPPPPPSDAGRFVRRVYDLANVEQR